MVPVPNTPLSLETFVPVRSLDSRTPQANTPSAIAARFDITVAQIEAFNANTFHWTGKWIDVTHCPVR